MLEFRSGHFKNSVRGKGEPLSRRREKVETSVSGLITRNVTTVTTI
jgi:hypothetical protein